VCNVLTTLKLILSYFFFSSTNSFSGHEELMLLFLAYQGPLIAEINALPIIFYKNEDVVFDNCDGNLNHVVQIVGYDLT
jgi:hypothetical protein